jgi:hypothetical protein
MKRQTHFEAPDTAMTRRMFLCHGTVAVGAGTGLFTAERAPGEQAERRATRRLLYSDLDIEGYRSRMSGTGPFYSRGDAGHGGPWSPNDGERSEQLAVAFLHNPRESYWSQPNLPYSSGDPGPPHSMPYARPMHAAWIYMTKSDHPKRGALLQEVKAFLLAHAANPTLDFSNDSSQVPPPEVEACNVNRSKRIV